MAILDKFKKKTFMVKTALGYVTYYFETLASIVKMADGRNVEDCINELNSNLGTISVQTHVTLTTGVTLERYGKNRILHFLNATSDEGGLITTLQGLDWPPFTCHAPIAIRGSSTANLYVSIDLNGHVVIWNNGKRQKATSAIVGVISWCVD